EAERIADLARPASFANRIHSIKRRAQGRWREVLIACGVSPELVNGRNQPCPACHGTDRFQFTDKYGAGNYHCRGCGAGDGFRLLQICSGIGFKEAVEQIEAQLGCAEPKESGRIPLVGGMKQLAERIWNEATEIDRGDAVDLYFRSRGVVMEGFPASL